MYCFGTFSDKTLHLRNGNRSAKITSPRYACHNPFRFIKNFISDQVALIRISLHHGNKRIVDIGIRLGNIFHNLFAISYAYQMKIKKAKNDHQIMILSSVEHIVHIVEKISIETSTIIAAIKQRIVLG